MHYRIYRSGVQFNPMYFHFHNDSLAVTTLQVCPSSESSYPVHFGNLESLQNLIAHHLPDAHQFLLVTDHNVQEFYLERIVNILGQSTASIHSIILPAGESSKSPAMLQKIYDEALDWGIDRQTAVVALGGGVIGDLAGYAAASLLRGLPLVHIPTSLVAQVDSSIGGKTGINHQQGKNLIGAFYQPAFVLSDVAVMDTLPEREWHGGLAELLKHAIIGSTSHLQEVAEDWPGLLRRDLSVITNAVPRSASVKVDVVSEDVHEVGRRAFLNFGHTYAHAIERVAGYGAFGHGEAVAIGMTCALKLSESHFPDLKPFTALELTTSIPLYADFSALSPDALFDAMQYDKKSQDGQRRFVLLEDIGRPSLHVCNDRERIINSWHSACRMLDTRAS